MVTKYMYIVLFKQYNHDVLIVMSCIIIVVHVHVLLIITSACVHVLVVMLLLLSYVITDSIS